MRILVTLSLAPLVLAACAEPALVVPVDGGWKGTYECGADSKKVTATLAEGADGKLGGEMFMDYQIVLLGTPILLTARADINAGERLEAVASGNLDVLDNSQGMPDWQFDLELNADADELDGTFETVDGEGTVTSTCDGHLERVTP